MQHAKKYETQKCVKMWLLIHVHPFNHCIFYFTKMIQLHHARWWHLHVTMSIHWLYTIWMGIQWYTSCN